MPTCRLCSGLFQTRIIVEGRLRNIANRTSCLSCVPFGSTAIGRRNGGTVSAEGSTRRCGTCDRDFKYSRRQGHRRNTCTACSHDLLRKQRKAKAVAIKGGKCSRCGYDRCMSALEFHHRDPSTKSFSLSGGDFCRAWDQIEKELEKCDLLCANCHREVEESLRSFAGVAQRQEQLPSKQ